jgi:hypothetical protein
VVLDNLSKGFTAVSLDESFFLYDNLVRKVWIFTNRRPVVRITGSHQQSCLFGAISLSIFGIIYMQLLQSYREKRDIKIKNIQNRIKKEIDSIKRKLIEFGIREIDINKLDQAGSKQEFEKVVKDVEPNYSFNRDKKSFWHKYIELRTNEIKIKKSRRLTRLRSLEEIEDQISSIESSSEYSLGLLNFGINSRVSV